MTQIFNTYVNVCRWQETVQFSLVIYCWPVVLVYHYWPITLSGPNYQKIYHKGKLKIKCSQRTEKDIRHIQRNGWTKLLVELASRLKFICSPSLSLSLSHTHTHTHTHKLTHTYALSLSLSLFRFLDVYPSQFLFICLSIYFYLSLSIYLFFSYFFQFLPLL